MKEKSLKINAFLNLIKSLMNIIFPIISFPYASRILMPDGIGKVNFANSIIEYFVLLAALGIVPYAAREAAKRRDDRNRLNEFSREILTINFFSTVVACMALFICFAFVPKFNEYRILIIICSTKVLFTTAGMEWLYRAEEEYAYITVRQIVFQIISLVLLFTLVRTKEDYFIYAGIGVFSNVGANVLNFVYSRKFINLFEKTKINLRQHFRPVLTFFGINSAGKINSALDAVMLGFLMGDLAVGFYSAAIKINRMVIELITSAVSSFMPRSSYYLENGQEKDYLMMIGKVCNATFFFSIPAAAGLFFLCRPIIIIFSGAQYLPAVPSMKILSISIIGSCANSFLNNLVITPQRKEKFTLLAQITAACSNITLNFFLIQKFEVFGAALATVIVEFILPLVVLIPSWRYVRSLSNFAGIIKAALGTAAMYTAIFFLCRNIKTPALQIFVAVAVGGTVYAGAEILLRHKTALAILEIITHKLRRQ